MEFTIYKQKFHPAFQGTQAGALKSKHFKMYSMQSFFYSLESYYRNTKHGCWDFRCMLIKTQNEMHKYQLALSTVRAW